MRIIIETDERTPVQMVTESASPAALDGGAAPVSIARIGSATVFPLRRETGNIEAMDAGTPPRELMNVFRVPAPSKRRAQRDYIDAGPGLGGMG